MNDTNVAVEENVESAESCELVELGEISEETKGLPIGKSPDGFFGLWGG